MVTHVSRAEWNARSPDCSEPLTKSKVNKFIVHYSGDSRSQTPRSIQDYCMDTKGHCDIDYNRIVRGDYDYMGRGWNVGGHTLNNNSTSYGVCMIGLNGDVTDADKRTIRAIYDEVCATLGRQITMTTHRNVLGASYTDCPGDNLDAWVDAGMPLPVGGGGVTDMFCMQDDAGQFPSKGPAVGAMQRMILLAGGDIGSSGIDLDFGPATSRGLAQVIGATDMDDLGRGIRPVYDDEAYVLLHSKVFGGTAPSGLVPHTHAVPNLSVSVTGSGSTGSATTGAAVAS